MWTALPTRITWMRSGSCPAWSPPTTTSACTHVAHTVPVLRHFTEIRWCSYIALNMIAEQQQQHMSNNKSFRSCHRRILNCACSQAYRQHPVAWVRRANRPAACLCHAHVETCTLRTNIPRTAAFQSCGASHMQDLGAAGLKAYYGSNLARLQAVKAGYDPATFFSYPSSIPPIKQS